MAKSWKSRSFEVLPALSVRRRSLRSSLRTVTVAWMFGVVWMAGVSGSQMTNFCWMLGFRDYDFGVLAAIPFAATFAQLLAAVMIERTGLRKYQFIYFATIHRLLWIAIAAVPLVVRPGRGAIVAFFAVYAVSSVLGHLSSPPWQTWMGDLIPRRIRGRYFAVRRIWTIPIQVAAVVLAGFLLDAATVRLPAGETISVAAQPLLLWTICGIFAVSAVFGAIDILLFLTMREIVSPPLVAGPPARPPRRWRQAARDLAERARMFRQAGVEGRFPRHGLDWAVRAFGDLLRKAVHPLAEVFGVLADAFSDRVFRHYALYGATITFAMTVGGNFFWNYALKNVGYSKLGANLVIQVCGAVSGLVMVRRWGRLVDLWGRRPVLILATIGVILGPAGWFFMPPGNLAVGYLLGVLTCVWGGVMWSAINLAQVNVVLGFSETAGRSKYVAASAVISAVGGFLGGLAGGKVAQSLVFLQAHPICLGPFQWNNYHATFLCSALARAAAILWLIGMPDPGARPFTAVVRELWFNPYATAVSLLFWPLRAIGPWRRRNEPHEDKRQGPGDWP